MKSLPAILAGLVVIAAVTTSALAGEQITLSDGVSGVANIIDTRPESITVSFVKDDATITLTLKVGQLDPHSFYEIRRDYMAETAENHLRLAMFCVKEGMFARAKFHLNAATALDPDYVKKVEAIPGVVDGVADVVLEHARRAYDAGDLETAESLAAAVVTRFPDSPAAVQAEALLSHLDDKEQVREAKRRAEVMKSARAAIGETEVEKLAERDKLLAPIYDRVDLARKIRSQGLREKNSTKARKTLEAAAAEHEQALEMIAKLSEEHAEDRALMSVLALGDIQIREDAVGCYINAGSLMIARGSYAEAEKFCRRALAVDPKSEEALSFQATVSTAAAWSSRR